MASNRATVEELIRRMNARDLHPTDLCHEEIEWHWPPTTPGAAVFRGHAGVTQGLEQWSESWEELDMEPEEVLEDGEYVLVILRYRMRGAGSGVYIEAPVAHLHQLTEDGLLRRWWMFGDAEKARRRFVAGDRPA